MSDTGCCIVQRANQGYALKPWHHSRGCKNYRPTMIAVHSAMTGDIRHIVTTSH